MTYRQAAGYLGLSVAQVRKACDGGRIVGRYHRDGVWLIPESSLDVFLAGFGGRAGFRAALLAKRRCEAASANGSSRGRKPTCVQRIGC